MKVKTLIVTAGLLAVAGWAYAEFGMKAKGGQFSQQFVNFKQQRLQKIESHINELRTRAQSAPSDQQQQWNKVIEDLQKKEDEAQKNLQELQSAKSAEDWQKEKKELANSVQDLEKASHDATRQIMDEKAAYQWELESHRDKLNFKIDSLNSQKNSVQDDQQKQQIDNQVKQLEEKKDKVDNYLNEVQGADNAKWAELKGRVDQDMRQWKADAESKMKKFGDKAEGKWDAFKGNTEDVADDAADSVDRNM